MQVLKPPGKIHGQRPWIFLAGSIEMGAAVDWQSQLTEKLSSLPGTIFNPRRDDWDSSWTQSIENDKFVEQVQWELDGLEAADLICLYFDPATKSPITLLELGLYARSKKVILCCPEGFWRKGNVDIVARRYYIQRAGSLRRMAELISNANWSIGRFNES
jgi:hypothetical protein